MALLDKRANGKPLQLIIGEWEFYGRPIKLCEGVFIPRPETERLVELILARIPEDRKLSGLEIGVGSGAICINLLVERPLLSMFGTDISEKPLDLTRQNAENLGVSDRLDLRKTNIAEGINARFDFIVSNPPYVLSEEMSDLHPEVEHDPKKALDGGDDGLWTTRGIVEAARELLIPSGFIAMEIHEKMGERVGELLAQNFSAVEIKKDLMGKDRYAFGRMP